MNAVMFKSVGEVKGWWIRTDNLGIEGWPLQTIQQEVLNIFPGILVEKDHIGCFPTKEAAEKFLEDIETYKRYRKSVKNPKELQSFSEWYQY